LKLDELGLLTDENIHPQVVEALRRRGADVLDIKESGWDGMQDLAILRKAYIENRVVLTHDSDFGKLAVTTGEPMVGIVYLRPGHIEPIFTLETLEVLFAELTDVTSPFIAVAERMEQRVRIRYRAL
jgi:predicted nuclease of predicted toxin-antitoxin system